MDEVLPAGRLGRKWVSDVVAETFGALGFEYVALNPGASFRGLHDSIVNGQVRKAPKIVLCLHEEHAIAIAHGYAKVTGRPMLAAIHTNVGLMHASMAIFNAWCDRVPVVIVGSNGPGDAAARRPWIDWLHTTADNGALVRPFVKWDDEPRSATAAVESMYRGKLLAEQRPAGPVYIAIDAQLQETAVGSEVDGASMRYRPISEPMPDPSRLAWLVDLLKSSRSPVFLFGRMTIDGEAWAHRVSLAERCGARVITDLRNAAAFPTDHPLHTEASGLYLSGGAKSALETADLIVAFEWSDLAGALASCGSTAIERTVVSVGLDTYAQRGWVKDYQALAMEAIMISGDVDLAVYALCRGVEHGEPRMKQSVAQSRGSGSTPEQRPASSGDRDQHDDVLTLDTLAAEVRRAFRGECVTYCRFPIGWPAGALEFRGPLDYLGTDGGAGVGSGPGLAVGVALGLVGSCRTPVAILGDGDFLMGCTAIWSGVAMRVGLLIIVANNQSFFNDELHQRRVAALRGRPIENAWIGQRIADPAIDICALARAQGAIAFGPVDDRADLRETLSQALEVAAASEVVVVDVRVATGYSTRSLSG